MKLLNFIQGRDNNFNLIRIIAAYAVLVNHSFTLATGRLNAQPFRMTIGMTIGDLAVDIFFLMSGFLVTASLLTRQSTIEFVWARVLRIYPALLTVLLLTVFGLGPLFTKLSMYYYFTDPKLYKYFLKCLTLITGVAFELPGVFVGNPYEKLVNGSLWTLQYEVIMYAILAIIWALLSVMPSFRQRAFKCTIISGAFLTGIYLILVDFILFGHFFYLFFTGSAFFILRDRIILSHSIFIICLSVLLLATYNTHMLTISYMTTLPYILFYVAYIPSGFIREYNKLGDYSYGVYIYAWPVQQSIAALVPGVSILSMVIISSATTLVFAALSWHLLEKRALNLKGHCVNHTIKLLSFGLTKASTRTR